MSPVELVRAAADARGLQPQRNGRGYRMLCPVHEDRRPSLDVDQADDGRALVKCRAGCDTVQVVSALGLTMRDLFDPSQAPAPPPPRRPVRKIRATDGDVRKWAADLQERDDLLERLAERRGWTREALSALDVGWDGQRLVFPVRGPDGGLEGLCRYLPGGDPKNISAGPRGLFPAPESLAADAGLMWLVEGEPDALALTSLGIPAVAIPGAETWRDEWACRFAGRRVVVCCDSDTAGRKVAQRAASALAPHAENVRTIDLAPAQDDGHDIGDLVAETHTARDRAELAAMLSQLASEAPSVDASSSSGKLRRLDVGRMLRTDPPPVPWLVQDLLVRGALTLLAGREGEGKSLTAMRAAVGVVTGTDLAGLDCAPGRVLLVDAENGEGELHRRLRNFGFPASRADRLIVCEAQGWHLGRELAELAGLIRQHRPQLVVLDSFRSLWPGGDENDSGAVGAALDPLRNLLREHNAAGLLLHHLSRGGDYRGSTAIGASCELVFRFESRDRDPDPQRRELTCRKCRPAAKPRPKWWRIAFDGRRLDLRPAEPFVDTARADARDEKAQRLMDVLRTAGAFPTWAAWARAADVSDEDGTARRARDELLEAGTAAKDERSGYLLPSAEGVPGCHGPIGAGTPGTPDDSGGATPPSDDPESLGNMGGATVAPLGGTPPDSRGATSPAASGAVAPVEVTR